jgi:Glycosidases
MDRSAILHIPLSQYAFVNSEKEITIRIRAKKKELKKCTLYFGDRVCKQSPMEFTSLPMSITAEDELFDYYETTFESPYTRVCYFFKLEDDKEWFYYYSNQFTKELPDFIIQGKLMDERSEYYQYPFLLRDEVVDVPEWFKNAIVYNIFPDSFATSKRYISCKGIEVQRSDGTICKSRLGGTIKGVLENLDYIENLGFNCIYLNPIFTAGEYHKYDVLDYYHIDPCFGTNEEFRQLVDRVHEKGMHIVIDGVFNHCSWKFFAFEDVIKEGEGSNYKDWFYDVTFPVARPQSDEEIPAYSCFAYERKMPKLNTSNRAVKDYFVAVGRYWIHEFKIDGWRLDVANEIDRNFWREFRNGVKEENPEAVLIGEVWENSEIWLRGDIFDSTMNYDFRKHCLDFFALDKFNAEQFGAKINQMYLRYSTNICNGQLNLLDSHDVARFLSLCNEDMKRWKQALVFLMLTPGVPSIVYGDEKEITGIEEIEYRQPMAWGKTENTQEDFIKKLISLRREYLEYDAKFRYHSIKTNDHVVFFSRSGKERSVRIVLNASEQEYNLKLKAEHKLLLEEGREKDRLKPGGFCVYLIKN